MDQQSDKLVVQLLRFVVRPTTQTMIATFRCADGSVMELELTAECAATIYGRRIVPRALSELWKNDPAGAKDEPAVPSVPITGCKVLVNEEGAPALLFDVAGTSPFAVQLCQKSAANLINELTQVLNTQPPPGQPPPGNKTH
jgi:hypothetical protein